MPPSERHLDDPENRKWLEATVRRFIKPELFDDAFQSAALMLLEREKYFDPARGKWRNWAFFLVRRECKMVAGAAASPVFVSKDSRPRRYKKEGAEIAGWVPLDTVPEDVLGTAPEDLEADSGTRLDVLKMLGVLPFSHREVVKLQHGIPDGVQLSCEEISVRLGVSPWRIKKMIKEVSTILKGRFKISGGLILDKGADHDREEGCSEGERGGS